MDDFETETDKFIDNYKKRKLLSLNNNNSTNVSNTTDTDAQTCSICTSPYTIAGNNTLSCLPCGHLYGYECIKKWILLNNNCPICRTNSKVKDVRKLRAQSTIAIDNTDYYNSNEKNIKLTSENICLQEEILRLTNKLNQTESTLTALSIVIHSDNPAKYNPIMDLSERLYNTMGPFDTSSNLSSSVLKRFPSLVSKISAPYIRHYPTSFKIAPSMERILAESKMNLTLTTNSNLTESTHNVNLNNSTIKQHSNSTINLPLPLPFINNNVNFFQIKTQFRPPPPPKI